MMGMLTSRWHDVTGVRNPTLVAVFVRRTALRLATLCNYGDRP